MSEALLAALPLLVAERVDAVDTVNVAAAACLSLRSFSLICL